MGLNRILNDGDTAGRGVDPLRWSYFFRRNKTNSKASMLMNPVGLSTKDPAFKRIVENFMFGLNVNGTPLNNYQHVQSSGLSVTEKIR